MFLVRSGDFIYVLSVLAPTYDAALVNRALAGLRFDVPPN